MTSIVSTVVFNSIKGGLDHIVRSNKISNRYLYESISMESDEGNNTRGCLLLCLICCTPLLESYFVLALQHPQPRIQKPLTCLLSKTIRPTRSLQNTISLTKNFASKR
ncbi:hypothetical protein CR513_01982, partial [Mucuna pruriens]